MTERYPKPSSNPAWHTNYPSGNGSTDPSGVRGDGWAVNAVPTSANANYLQRMVGDYLQWIEDYGARQWGDVYEGIGDVANWDIFRVITQDMERGSLVFDVYGKIGTYQDVDEICTDGERIYCTTGTSPAFQWIVAKSPADGSDTWSADKSEVITGLCTDGEYLYAHAFTTTGLLVIDRDDGSTDSNTGSEYRASKLCTNGEYCVGVDPYGKPGYVVFYSGLHGTVAEDGTYNTGSAGLKTSAIDADQCYVGGSRNTYDVWALDLATRAYTWRITFPTSGTPAVLAIAADGNRVYVATSRTALTAGGYANLYALDRFTGRVIWQMDLGGLYDMKYLTLDEKYLYVTNDDISPLCYIISLEHEHAIVKTLDDIGAKCCDGVSLIGDDGLSQNVKRVLTANGCMLMQKVPTNDPHRRPFHNIAIPAMK